MIDAQTPYIISSGDKIKFLIVPSLPKCYIQDLIARNDSNSNDLLTKAEDFACAVLPESPLKNVDYSPGLDSIHSSFDS